MDPGAAASKVADTLPPCIYSFSIVGCSGESSVAAANKAVLNVLMSKEQKFPDLGSITISVDKRTVAYYRQVTRETKALAEKQEVYFGGRIEVETFEYEGLIFQSLDSDEESGERMDSEHENGEADEADEADEDANKGQIIIIVRAFFGSILTAHTD